MNKALIVASIYLSLSFGSEAQVFSDTLISLLHNNTLLSQVEANPSVVARRTLYNAYIKPSNAFSEFGIQNYLGIFNNGLASKAQDIKDGEENFILSIRVKDNKIVVAALSSCVWPNCDTVKRIYTRIDTALASQLLTQHNTQYLSSWALEDLAKSYGPSGTTALDFGWLNPVSKEAIELANLVANKNHRALFLLASSLEPESRIDGTIGLFALQEDGEILSKDEKQLILINQSSAVGITIKQGDYSHEDSMANWLDDKSIRGLNTYFKTIKTR